MKRAGFEFSNPANFIILLCFCFYVSVELEFVPKLFEGVLEVG